MTLSNLIISRRASLEGVSYASLEVFCILYGAALLCYMAFRKTGDCVYKGEGEVEFWRKVMAMLQLMMNESSG